MTGAVEGTGGEGHSISTLEPHLLPLGKGHKPHPAFLALHVFPHLVAVSSHVSIYTIDKCIYQVRCKEYFSTWLLRTFSHCAPIVGWDNEKVWQKPSVCSTQLGE